MSPDGARPEQPSALHRVVTPRRRETVTPLSTLPRLRPLAAMLVVALVAGLVATTAPAASAAGQIPRSVSFAGVPTTGATVGDVVTFTAATQPDNRAAEGVRLMPYSEGVCRLLSYDQATFQVRVELTGGGACSFMFSSEAYDSGGLFGHDYWAFGYGQMMIYVDAHVTRTVTIEGGPTGPVSGDQISFTAYTAPDHAPIDMIYSVSGSCRLEGYNSSTLRVTLDVIGNGTCWGVLHSNQSTNGTLAHRVFSFEVNDSRRAQSVYLSLADRPSWPDPTPIGATSDSGGPLTYTTSTPDVCAIDGANFIPRQAGRCWITATQAGNSEWWAASATDFFDMKVTDRPQTITFPFVSDMRLDDERWDRASLNITASSGLPVIVYSETPNTCYVSDGVAYATSAGTCTVIAKQPGVWGSWTYASAERTWTIDFPWYFYIAPNPYDILQFPAIGTRKATDGPFTIVANGGPPTSVSTLSPDTCAVSGHVVTPRAVGVCTLRAIQAGNQYMPPAVKDQSFQLAPGAHSLDFATLPGRTYGQPATTLQATATSGLPVSFITSTPDVCSVTDDVVATATVGVCTVRAEAGGGLWAEVAQEQSFLVSPTPQTLTFTELPDRTYGEGPRTLTATSSSGLPVTFTTSSPEVCDVTDDVVSIKKAGTCAVHATSGNELWEMATEDRYFDVVPGSQTLDFPAITDQQVDVGTLTPPVTASSGLPVTLTTTTPAVCAVDGAQVKVLRLGRCTVAARSASESWTPVSGEQSFDVTPAIQTIDFAPLADRPFGSAPSDLSATASSGLPVTFTTTTQDVCAVEDTQLSVLRVGVCTVRAEAGDDSWSTVVAERSLEVTPAEQTVMLTGLRGTPLSSESLTVVAASDAGLPVTLTSSTPEVCSVEGSVVTLSRAGTCTIAGAAAGNTNVAPAQPVVVSFPVWATPAVPSNTRIARIHEVLGVGEKALHVSARTPAKCRVHQGRLVVIAPGVCRAVVVGPGNRIVRHVATTAAHAAPGAARSQIRHAVTVYFAPGSATLTSRGQTALTKAAPGLRAATLVAVYGHTHAGGPDGEQPGLSAARANRVATFLQSRGVTVRPTTVALGARQHSGGGAAALNRRVQVRFL